jgi:hypothetical protein
VWHTRLNCTGIKHCQYPHKDILRTSPAYDRVKIENINNLAKEASQRYQHRTIIEEIRTVTEEFYYGFLQTWESSRGCSFPVTKESICLAQAPYVFERNNVRKFKLAYFVSYSIGYTYTKHIQSTFVGCPLNSNLEPWHRATAIPRLTIRIDLEYFKSLVQYGYCEKKQSCTYIGQTSSRQTFCGKHKPYRC